MNYITNLVQNKTDNRVFSGPFVGMKYVQQTIGSAYLPKLIGTYEMELQNVIENICKSQPTVVVDIGAAEGYYAVGFALRCPHAKIIAFEMEDRSLLCKMSELNQCADRISIRGKCEPSDLSLTLVKGSVIICDTEGYEQYLLDPIQIEQLNNTTILVEMHDFLVPEITNTLYERFAGTHRINQINETPRYIEQFPWKTLGTQLLGDKYIKWALSENRPVRMHWLYMEPVC